MEPRNEFSPGRDKEKLLTSVPNGFREILLDQAKYKEMIWKIELQRLAKAEQAIERKSIEGLGEKTMQIPLDVALTMCRRWGRKNFFNKDVLNWVKKNHPEMCCNKPKQKTFKSADTKYLVA